MINLIQSEVAAAKPPRKERGKMGYGNIRGGRLIQEIAEIIDEYCKRYEPEFFITDVDKELAERGLSLDIKWN